MSARSLLPALLAAVILPLLIVAPGTAAASPASATASTALPDEDPLELTLSSMTPSALSTDEPIVLRGRITNTSDETWNTVNVYPFASWNRTEPIVITSTDQLAAEMERPTDDPVGGRFTESKNYWKIDELAPGQSARYTVRITAGQAAAATEAGVYWIGAHAMGQTDSVGRDQFADGRARTFIPLVPEDAPAVPTSVVASLRTGIAYSTDGSIADPQRWAERLGRNGRLSRLLRLGATDGFPVTWLVDPAVGDAVQRLARGNPTRSLDATTTPDGRPTDPGSPSPSASPTADGSPGSSVEPAGDQSPDGDGQTGQGAEEEFRLATTARSWLDRARSALSGHELLLLPYGDTVLSAAVEHDRAWYTKARARSGSILRPWNLPGRPAVAAPNGLLSRAAIDAVPDGTTILLSDAAFPDAATPTNVSIDDHQVVVTNSTVAAGGPGPDDPLGPVALRQQLLAEAGLRALTEEPDPLVVQLPPSWQGPRTNRAATRFLSGLQQPWIRPRTLSSVSIDASTVVPADDMSVEDDQLGRQLPAASFAAARRLTRVGARLGRVLFRNDTVSDEVEDQALTSTSYAAAATPVISRAPVDQTAALLQGRLASIRVEDPLPVTLSGESGEFGVVLVNGLPQPVEVRLVAEAEDGVRVRTPGRIRLQPNARTTVYSDASSSVLGRHDATLRLTDLAGNPIGASAVVQIRATQVSRVIWVVIAVGLVLLFSAILVRLFRRTREALR